MAESSWYVGAVASVAGANKHHLTLWNGAGSGKIIKVRQIIASGAPTAAVTGQIIALQAIRISTAPTGGTVTPSLACAGNEAALPAQIEARRAPTNSPTEETSPFGIGTVSGEETGAPFRASIYEYSIDGSKPVELAAGQGLTVKQGALASAGATSILIMFTVV